MAEPLSKPNYSGFPEESMIRHFRNNLLALKKSIQSSKNRDELKMQMEHFLSSSRKVAWPHQTSGIFRKEEAEKAIQKVTVEFQRYVNALQDNREIPHHDLIESLRIVETLLDQLKEKR